VLPVSAGRTRYASLASSLDTAEEVGLGDVIKRATYAVGIGPFAGCARRTAALNQWVVFTHGAPDFRQS
jgi:hypothetical protein